MYEPRVENPGPRILSMENPGCLMGILIMNQESFSTTQILVWVFFKAHFGSMRENPFGVNS